MVSEKLTVSIVRAEVEKAFLRNVGIYRRVYAEPKPGRCSSFSHCCGNLESLEYRVIRGASAIPNFFCGFNADTLL
jgi:hypothetical protein